MTDSEEGELARYRAPALEKGLDILELLARQPTGMSMTAIAKEMGRSMGEIYRIALALEARGYILREPESDSFSLSLKLFELATEHPPINRLLSAALPEMQSLAAAAEQCCHLGLLEGDHLLVVAQIDSPRPMRYAVRLGARFPILETSSGAVLVAFADKPELRARAAAQSPDYGSDIEARCAAIRRYGGERRESLVVAGVTNLSRPIFDLQGIVAVLTVPYLRQKGLTVDIDGAERLVAKAAARLSKALGGRDSARKNLAEEAA